MTPHPHPASIPRTLMRAAAAILSLAGFTLLAVAYSAPCPSAGGTAPWLLGFILRLTAALACLAAALRIIDNTPSKISSTKP